MDSIEVQGDYNSPRARTLTFFLEKCDPEKYTNGKCKSDEEITKWLQRKFVVVYYNQMRFNTRDYAPDDKISREGKLDYIPINTQMREEVVYQIQLTQLQLQDEYY